MLKEMRRLMLRLKRLDWKTTGARVIGTCALAGVVGIGLLGLTGGRGEGRVSAADTTTTKETTTKRTTTVGKIGPAAPVTYDNRYEIYAGLNFMNFQAGQALPKRMNLGGGEFLATYWLPGDHWFTRNLGLAHAFRGGAGQ